MQKGKQSGMARTKVVAAAGGSSGKASKKRKRENAPVSESENPGNDSSSDSSEDERHRKAAAAGSATVGKARQSAAKPKQKKDMHRVMTLSPEEVKALHKIRQAGGGGKRKITSEPEDEEPGDEPKKGRRQLDKTVQQNAT
jgi:hypothetical protein